MMFSTLVRPMQTVAPREHQQRSSERSRSKVTFRVGLVGEATSLQDGADDGQVTGQNRLVQQRLAV